MGIPPPIRILIENAEADPIDRVFTETFRIGRDHDCEVPVQNSHVSRNHAEVQFKDRCWWVHDLDSTNGIYLNGKKIKHAPLMEGDVLVLGKDGPRAIFSYLSPEAAAAFVPQGAKQHRGRRRLGGNRVLAVFLIALLLGGFGFFFGRRQLDENAVLRQKAGMLFSDIRANEVEMASLYARRGEMDKLFFAQRLNELEARQNEALDQYKGYLIQLGMYQSFDAQENQIYNVARFFNESELAIPPEFMEAVRAAVYEYWLDEGMAWFKEALARAQLFDYTPVVINSLEQYGLPVEFFYLPLTLSGFNPDSERVFEDGHTTAGVWHLSDATAAMLQVGGAVSGVATSILPVEGRRDVRASTAAAVQWLHRIYREEALASGLLTLAVYLRHEQQLAGMGHTALAEVLEGVPATAEARTLWYIREHFPQRIPDDVYQRVVNIFAAAVIGQDPAAFGLDLVTPTTVPSFSAYR